MWQTRWTMASEVSRNRVFHTLKWCAAAGALALAGCLLVLMALHDRIVNPIVFPATRDIYRDPGAFGWAFEDLYLAVGDERTHAWHIPLENARGTALFSHGNAGNMADRLESVGLLRRLGFSVLVYDYGGYGNSTGGVGEARCYADIRAAWAYLTQTRGIPPSEIVLFGRSLGGAVTADLAQEVTPAAVVLESTFLSIPDVAREMISVVPLYRLLRIRFASKDKVGKISAPVLFVHSPEDDMIPYRHGRELFARAPEPKRFLEIHGPHNDGFVSSMDVYVKGWEEFLAPILPRRDGAPHST